MRIDEKSLLTAVLAGAILADQLGQRPPPIVKVVVTIATAVSFALALRAAFQPDGQVMIEELPQNPLLQTNLALPPPIYTPY